jgi:5'-AMP-activated protein kinase catalytic alpha subunit/carbon catabolite-derepressing protein kinase
MKHPWFLKKFELPTKSSVFESDYKEYCKFDKSAAGGINAFDLISLSSGLDLSGLFEVKHARDRRFTSSETVERVTERVREVGGRLGYIVEEGMVGGAIGLGKGRVGLVFEVWEIVEKLLVVEVKVVERGGVEFEDLHWGELKEGLGDVVLQWNDDAM